MNLREEIEKYVPYNEQEEKDKQAMLKYMNIFDNVFQRENECAHFTASAWVVNKDRSKILMVYHNIYGSWACSGGHADGEENLLEVAIREAKEETGIRQVKIVKKDIFSLEVICTNGHIKNNGYVSSHLHLNITYLLEADEAEPLKIKMDENSNVKWMTVEELQEQSTEKWMKENVYKKLHEKLIYDS